MLLNRGKQPSTTKMQTTTKRPKSVHSTQQVSSKLNIKSNGNERIVGVGTGSRDLKSRTQTISNTKGLKPESVSGWRSGVDWKGKTQTINGRTIAVGPGTFTFGTSPTGAFVRKESGGH
ncbi:hypothetical protein OESDEN_09051 [Oesophagostomum dentatum]|uniref:Uncharacterized protein n=1 Tax=Oesophagostomum dentatum TaxID=61180 RepID=A0A0B1T4M9_OESDE|nr:hypothetical protein OESDEN_09051 [Oesophagostomum dentatum]